MIAFAEAGKLPSQSLAHWDSFMFLAFSSGETTCLRQEHIVDATELIKAFVDRLLDGSAVLRIPSALPHSEEVG